MYYGERKLFTGKTDKKSLSSTLIILFSRGTNLQFLLSY